MPSRLLCSTITLLSALAARARGGNGEAAPPYSSATQYLVISIDVEAQPRRQSDNHVQRLIYGNFPGVGRAGIVEMMDVADRRNVRLTFFLDVLEELIYPTEIEPVARLIVERGHDLQLHTHPENMSDEFFRRLGTNRKDTNEFSETEAEALFDEVKGIVAGWGIPSFVAYRAGSYRFSRGLVLAMPKAGLKYSYNYNIQGPSQRKLNLKNAPMFQWENGISEIPISYINQDKSNAVRLDDSIYVRKGDVQSACKSIRGLQDQWTSPNVLVMMLHSWSLLSVNSQSKFFEYKDSTRLVLFDRFLASLPETVRVVTASEVSHLIARGVVSIADRMSTADVFGN